jgi:hypothetical protein
MSQFSLGTSESEADGCYLLILDLENCLWHIVYLREIKMLCDVHKGCTPQLYFSDIDNKDDEKEKNIGHYG